MLLVEQNQEIRFKFIMNEITCHALKMLNFAFEETTICQTTYVLEVL